MFIACIRLLVPVASAIAESFVLGHPSRRPPGHSYLRNRRCAETSAFTGYAKTGPRSVTKHQPMAAASPALASGRIRHRNQVSGSVEAADHGAGLSITHTLPRGHHTITATATDAQGKTGQGGVHVTVVAN